MYKTGIDAMNDKTHGKHEPDFRDPVTPEAARDEQLDGDADEGCQWVFHDGSHCGRPCNRRYGDLCDVHGMLAG